MSDTRKLAERIARELFTNNWGERAERLVLEASDEHFKSKYGGWCQKAVIDRIAELLDGAATAEEPGAPAAREQAEER